MDKGIGWLEPQSDLGGGPWLEPGGGGKAQHDCLYCGNDLLSLFLDDYDSLAQSHRTSQILVLADSRSGWVFRDLLVCLKV